MGEVQEHTSGPVDIPESFCAEIRELARTLPRMTYHELLGIERDADAEAVRRAFFQRSKAFHPDRYFNRRLGPYEPLLHEIYKRVVLAHEVLRDEKLRADYERTLRAEPSFRIVPPKLIGLPGAEPLAEPEPAEAAEPAAAEPVAEQEKPRPRKRSGKGRSLRDRKGLRSKDTILRDLELRLESSRKKARVHFEAAQEEIEGGDLQRAASLLRLALAYDPRDHDFHNALADVLPRAHAEQAASLRAKGDLLLTRGDEEGAFEMLLEAFRLVPTDAPLAHQLAELYRKRDEADAAAELAREAVELDEKSAEYRKTFGMILMEQGKRAEARKELTRAWEMDPMDRDVKKALSVL